MITNPSVIQVSNTLMNVGAYGHIANNFTYIELPPHKCTMDDVVPYLLILLYPASGLFYSRLLSSRTVY